MATNIAVIGHADGHEQTVITFDNIHEEAEALRQFRKRVLVDYDLPAEHEVYIDFILSSASPIIAD